MGLARKSRRQLPALEVRNCSTSFPSRVLKSGCRTVRSVKRLSRGVLRFDTTVSRPRQQAGDSIVEPPIDHLVCPERRNSLVIVLPPSIKSALTKLNPFPSARPPLPRSQFTAVFALERMGRNRRAKKIQGADLARSAGCEPSQEGLSALDFPSRAGESADIPLNGMARSSSWMEW
jgi:hypothetical protein